MGVNPKIGGFYPPKMDGENNGIFPIKHGMIWGVFPLFLGQHPDIVFIECFHGNLRVLPPNAIPPRK